MKKIAALLLVLCLMVGLTGCFAKVTEEVMKPQLGTVSGTTYTNEFLGASITLEDPWYIYNEEDLAELNGAMIDATDNEELAKMLEQSKTAYGLYAMNKETAEGINITIESLGLVNGMVYDEKAYAEAGMKQLTPALESYGMTDISCEVITVTFNGGEHAGIRVHGTMNGVDCYETMACVKVGTYIVNITAVSYGTDTTTELLDMFTPLNADK